MRLIHILTFSVGAYRASFAFAAVPTPAQVREAAAKVEWMVGKEATVDAFLTCIPWYRIENAAAQIESAFRCVSPRGQTMISLEGAELQELTPELPRLGVTIPDVTA